MNWHNSSMRKKKNKKKDVHIIFIQSKVLKILTVKLLLPAQRFATSADPEGRGGAGGPDPPPPQGKSQVIWLSIRNKQFDPPPPPLENVGPPSETLKKMIDFFEFRAFFVKLTWSPWRKFLHPRMCKYILITIHIDFNKIGWYFFLGRIDQGRND